MDSVPLVSPARKAALETLGIRTVRDLLNHFPRRYIDLSSIYTIAQAPVGESCTIRGTIHEIRLKKPKPRLQLVEITLVDSTSTMIVTCFKQPWLMKQYQAGDHIAVAGKLEFDYGYKRMVNPYIDKVEPGTALSAGTIIPVHPASEKVSAALMRRIILNALDMVAESSDPLPLSLRRKYRLMGRFQAYQSIHFPSEMGQVAEAKRRLAFEELLYLELALIGRRMGKGDGAHRCHVVDGPLMKSLVASLPFTLTKGQEGAIGDIAHDMQGAYPMNRLLLGDVGTGKTVVAAIAIAMACDTSTQAALMAPTEVLAQQHAASIGGWLDELGIPWALLTGSTPKERKGDIAMGLADGSLQVCIGTHALIEPDVRFKDCSLAIIDEQQRFGVEQREALVAKGKGADALFLTATPIPRTLALALYGDLTLSYLRDKPSGRALRTTRVVARSEKDIAYEAAREALGRGERVFVVCPLIGEEGLSAPKRSQGDAEGYVYASIAIEDEGDFPDADISSAKREAEFLRDKVFSEYEVGLLHGQMRSEEKRRVMESFSRGEVQVLVSTTVIEVGIDVAEATVMIIHDADRFGLSQLHQLRGRVGRGVRPSQVFLISGSTNPESLERLAKMQDSDDGFELAEFDLSLRREGDILGNRQHGASKLKLVNIVRDGKIVEAAHREANALLAHDPLLEDESCRALSRDVRMVYREDTMRNGG